MKIAWPGGAIAAVTISFDDGYATTYENTICALQERQLFGTYNIIPSQVGAIFSGELTASWEDWRKAARMGHEIASHGFFHSPLSGRVSELRRLLNNLFVTHNRVAYMKQLYRTISTLHQWQKQSQTQSKTPQPKQTDRHLQSSRMIIDEKISGLTTESFAYPSGGYDSASKKAVRLAGFRSARTLDLGLNQLPIGYYSLRSISLGPGMSVDDYIPWLEKACKTNAWLIVVLHLVGEKNPNNYPYFCSFSNWQRLLELFEHYPLWIATQRDVIRYLTTHSKDLFNA